MQDRSAGLSVAVTTSLKATYTQKSTARAVSRLLGCHLVERGEQTILGLLASFDVLVVAGDRLTVYDRQGHAAFYHPGMGLVRMKRLVSGETDLLMRLSGVSDGDIVVDCTLGFASDAIVFSHCVGPRGRVIGIEANPIVWMLTKLGLYSFPVDVPVAKEAMTRIEVVCMDHTQYLSSLSPGSVDVVYFDPMFRSTVASSASMEGLRHFGLELGLAEEAVVMARRAARKSVILKERTGSVEFARFGFTEYIRRSRRFSYGVIRIEQ